MPEIKHIEKFFEMDHNEKANDENSEKESKITKIHHSPKEQNFSEFHISFLIAFVECDYQKVNNVLSKDPSLVNMKNPFDGNTALHFASKFGDIALIRALIGNYKADVNVINHSGKTPLHYAAEFSKEEVVNILVSNYNARKDIRDYNGKLAIDWVKPDKLDSMEKLLGKPFSLSIVKEERDKPQRFSSMLKNFGSILTFEGSQKHGSSFKKADSTSSSCRSVTPTSSIDTSSSRNFLSLTNSDIERSPHMKKSLGGAKPEKSNKSVPGIRGSFSGHFN